MSEQIPATGVIRVRVLQVNTHVRGETVHDVKARTLPREENARPVQFQIRDELCSSAPKAGDRLRLTLQLGQVAGVEVLKSKGGRGKPSENPGEDD